MSNGIEWVVTLKLEDGSTLRGVQVAMFGHPAMDFFAKRKGVKSVSAMAEKKMHFDRFLEDGLRKPLTEDELA
jgi:hypothetical protein